MLATHLGFYNTATTRTHVRFMFSTHAAAGGNVAPNSAFEAADIRIYRANDSAANSATQRSSANGITMTSPFDSLTGVHDVDIDLTDNTDAGFYASGYQYTVMLAPDETVDGATLTGVILAYFEIGLRTVNTTHLSGTSQTARDIGASVLLSSGTGTGQVTLTSGRVNADITHIATAAVSASTAQLGVNVVNWGGTAVGSTTVRADVINWGGVGIATPPAVNATQISGDSTAADTLESWLDGTAGAYPELGIIDQGTAQSATATTCVLRAATPFSSDDACVGATLMVLGSTQGYWQSRLITAFTTADDTATVDTWDVTPSGTITYKVFGSAPSSASSPPTAAAIADAVWDEATTGHTTSGTFGEQLKTDVDAILADTDVIGATGAGLTSLATQASVNTIDDFLDTEMAAVLAAVDTEVAAIKAKTDQLTFTVANQVDANTESINATTVLGDGTSGDLWRG